MAKWEIDDDVSALWFFMIWQIKKLFFQPWKFYDRNNLFSKIVIIIDY